MNELNPKLFKGIYEIYNIDTDTVSDIVVADSEYDALPNGNENESANDFFEEKRTIQDLREELKDGDLELIDALKSVEDLFYDIFDKEEYEIKDLLHTHGSTQYVVIDKVQGHEVTFDISEDYNVFNVVASGSLFANKYTTKWWLKYLELLDEVQSLIFIFKHPELDNE